MNISLDLLKKDALAKIAEGEVASTTIIEYLKEKHPCTENEALFVVMDAILEKKIKYRVDNGIMLYSLGVMSPKEVETATKDMQSLLKKKWEYNA